MAKAKTADAPKAARRAGILFRVNKGKMGFLARKNPIYSRRVDPLTGMPEIIGWTPGKVRGDQLPTKKNPSGRDQFLWEGELWEAPSWATAVDPKVRDAITKAKAEHADMKRKAARAQHTMAMPSVEDIRRQVADEMSAALRAELEPQIRAQVSKEIEEQLVTEAAEEEAASEAAAEDAAAEDEDDEPRVETTGSGG